MAALLVSSAAICTAAQINPLRKENARESQTTPPAGANRESEDPTVSREHETDSTTVPTTRKQAKSIEYSYEFTQPAFQLSHVLIEHDAVGGGKITFERRNSDPIVDPLELSAATIERLTMLWKALRFLDSTTNYQSEKQYPHMGTMRLQMKQASRDRVAEFNWTSDKDAFALVKEYKRIANQAIFIFDITLARENQPLDAPKLMDQLDAYVRRNDLADTQQMIPLLRELSTDERIPLMSRNSAARILKKIEK
jgi:hypothetical protein